MRQALSAGGWTPSACASLALVLLACSASDPDTEPPPGDDVGPPVAPASSVRQAGRIAYPGLDGVAFADVPAGWTGEDGFRPDSGNVFTHTGRRASARVSVQLKASHAAALETLRDAENKERSKGEFVPIAGWPAYHRDRFECQPWMQGEHCYTAAVAAGKYTIHVFATMKEEEFAARLPEVRAIVERMLLPETADPEQTAHELDELRHRTPVLTPLRADEEPDPALTGPRRPELLGAADRFVYERRESGVFAWSASRGFAARARAFERWPMFAADVVAVGAGGPCACALGRDGALACAAKSADARLDDLPLGRFAEVAVGGLPPIPNDIAGEDFSSCHVCAADTEGRVICATSRPAMHAPRGSFHNLAAGEHITCALDRSGRPVCWSYKTYADDRARIAPAPEGTFAELALGSFQSCGRRADGTVLCWQSWDEPLDRRECRSPGACGIASPGNRRFKQISAGHRHNCGITIDDKVYCWGNRERGQAAVPGGRFIRVVSGRDFSCAMRPGGVVACWGSGFTTKWSDDGTRAIADWRRRRR
jgi:hypothetical protein